MRNGSWAFRVSLRLIEAASRLTPRAHRDEWRRVWLGEVFHRARVLESEGRLSGALARDLVRRSFGAFSHALSLRLREWRLSSMIRDLVQGLRSLRSRPGFTLAALGTLALGIGANTYTFSMAEGVLLHPFPYRDIDRLVAIQAQFPRQSLDEIFIEALSLQDFDLLREETRTLRSLLAFDLGNRDLGGVGEPQRLLTAAIWGDPFATLGMSPALGRGFTREEIERNEPVAIVSHRVFQQHLGGDPSWIGRPVLINGSPRTLVGVMPPRLLLLDTDLWLPMWYEGTELPRSRRVLTVLGRLAEGASLEEAASELQVLARRIEREAAPEAPEYEGFRLTAQPFLDVWASFVGPGAFLLVGASAVALLVACGNIASLLLARGAARRHEMAVRTAMGAERRHLVRQLLTEALLLAFGGGALALVLARWGIDATVKRLPSSLPLAGLEIGIDPTVLGYTFVVCLLSAVVFGLAPALQAAGVSVVAMLSAEGGRTSPTAGSLRLRRAFVALQIGLSLVLLSAASLLAKSFFRLSRVDPGVSIDDVLTLRVTLPWERYQGGLESFYRRWLQALGEVPGVRAYGIATQFPPMVFFDGALEVEGRETATEGSLPMAFYTVASPGLFEALGMPRLRGRSLTELDGPESPRAYVVNQALARRYFEGEEPLGKRIRLAPGEEAPWGTIVGIVADARNRGLDREPEPEVFVSYRQEGQWSNQMHLILATETDPRAALPAVKKTLRDLDPHLPVYAVATLAERFDTLTFSRRVASVLMASFAVLALLLSSLGLYGVISFMVGESRRELGIRIALGAGRRRLLTHVLRQAGSMVLAGVVLGVGAALLVGRALSDLLFQIEPHDPATLLYAVGILSAVALAAVIVPARRAASVDPLASIR